MFKKIFKKKVKEFPPDFEKLHISIIEKVKKETMTSNERIFSLIEAVKYIIKGGIEGDIVECGVWRGGSVMAILNVLKELKSDDKNIYLYDTFDGMSEPTADDVSFDGRSAKELLDESEKDEQNVIWAYSGKDIVKKNVFATGYDREKIHFVQGKVEDTIPTTIPDKISLLRLDTDWYESTKHELEHLFPRLSKGGILILDDYGHWQGARKAADEYFYNNKVNIFLSRVDYTGRIAVRQ
jgi:O-methyltransferase